MLSVTAWPSRVMSSTLFPRLCVKPPRFMCVCLRTCARVCVHVRAFTLQSGNCRCWFVCSWGSACTLQSGLSLKGHILLQTFLLKSFQFLPNLIFKNTRRFHPKLFQIILRIKVTYSCLTVCGSGLKTRSVPTFLHLCSSLIPHSTSSSPSLSLTVGLVLSVPAVGDRYTPATGCGVQGETHTTWLVLLATRVRGSYQRAKSLV